MAVSVLNTDAGLSGKTLLLAESAQTITAEKTFDLDPNAPFAVSSGSAVVLNLDADKVDGIEGTAMAQLAAANAMTGANTFSSATPIILSHASGGVRERNRSFQMGEWQAVTQSDANFTGAGTDASWVVEVGDQQVFKYTLVGRMLTVMLTVATSTVASAPATLTALIPGSFSAVILAGGTFFYSDNGTAGVGRWYVDTAGTVINFAKMSGNWTNSTNLTTVQGVFTFEV